MKRLATFFVLCTITCSMHSKKTFSVRVLLDVYKTEANAPREAFASHQAQTFYVTTQSRKEKTRQLSKATLEVLAQNNRLYVRNHRRKGAFTRVSSNKIYIKSKSKTIGLTSKKKGTKHYRGILIFELDRKQKKLFLINKLPLEQYVYGVLRQESYPTWPNQMQKIQAIISRTYAIKQIIEQRKKKQHPNYDVKSNNWHQCYDGNHDCLHLKQAVTETKHLILTHEDQPALTMFDACCGGCTPAYIEGLDFKKAPYLARKTPCHYCKDYCLYRWKRIITANQLISALCSYKPTSKKFLRKRSLNFIQVVERDGAGIVKKIKVQQKNRRTQYISGKELWMSMRNRIRSQNFTLQKSGNNIVIQGKGFGHQIGLCQRGARELVRNNWPIKKILAFYYPETEVAKLV